MDVRVFLRSDTLKSEAKRGYKSYCNTYKYTLILDNGVGRCYNLANHAEGGL